MGTGTRECKRNNNTQQWKVVKAGIQQEKAIIIQAVGWGISVNPWLWLPRQVGTQGLVGPEEGPTNRSMG